MSRPTFSDSAIIIIDSDDEDSNDIDCTNCHSYQEIPKKVTSEEQTKMKTKNNNSLERLAKELAHVVGLSLEQVNYRKLSNMEKTILEVSKCDFDISGLVPPRCSKTSFTAPRKKRRKYHSSDSTASKLSRLCTPAESQYLVPDKQSSQIKKRKQSSQRQLRDNDSISETRLEEQSNLTNEEIKCKNSFVSTESETSQTDTFTYSSLVFSPENNSTPMNLIMNEKESPYSPYRYKNDTFSVVKSISSEIENGTGNSLKITIRRHSLKDSEKSSIATSESTDIGSNNRVNYQLETTSPLFSELTKHSSNVPDSSVKVLDEVSDSETRKSYGRNDPSTEQEKERRKEIRSIPHNPQTSNNVINTTYNGKCSPISESITQPSKPNDFELESLTDPQEIIDREVEVVQADFVTSYSIIFDENMTNLCKEMANILFLAMKKDQTSTHTLTAERISCKQLNEKEEASHDTYKTSFTSIFKTIVDSKLSKLPKNQSQKSFVLAWFIKLFLKLTDLSQEFSDSLTLVWRKTVDLLSDCEFSFLQFKEIFSLSEDDFEKECWKTLDLLHQSFANGEHQSESVTEE